MKDAVNIREGKKFAKVLEKAGKEVTEVRRFLLRSARGSRHAKATDVEEWVRFLKMAAKHAQGKPEGRENLYVYLIGRVLLHCAWTGYGLVHDVVRRLH